MECLIIDFVFQVLKLKSYVLLSGGNLRFNNNSNTNYVHKWKVIQPKTIKSTTVEIITEWHGSSATHTKLL